MLEKAKLAIGAVVAGGLLVLLLTAVATYVSRGKEVKELRGTVTALEIENGSLKEAAKKEEKSNAITEKTEVVIEEKARVIVEKDKKASSDLQKKEIDIRNDFSKQEPTAENLKKKTDAVSQARIESLWQSWCESTDHSAQADCGAAK